MGSERRLYRAVVFDCDGTLLDSEALAVQCERRLLVEHGYEPTEEDIEAVVGTTQQATYEYYLARVPGLPAPAEFWSAFERLFYDLASEHLRPFPDAVKAVDHLSERGIPLAVASSTPRERLRWQLSVGGFDGRFGAMIGGDEVAAGKPAPDIYLAAAAGIGAEPRTCLAVEDTVTGAEAARAAGMRVIGIDRGGGSLPTDVMVDDLFSADALAEWARLSV